MKKESEVIIPEGKCCAYCCGDCNYMDLYSKNNYGEAYGRKNEWNAPC